MNEARSSGVARRTRSQPSTRVVARPNDGVIPPELDDAIVRTDAAPIHGTRCHGAATTLLLFTMMFRWSTMRFGTMCERERRVG